MDDTLIADCVWRFQAQLALATVDWVAWSDHDLMHSSFGDIPLVEFEQHGAALALNAPNGVAGSVMPIFQKLAHALGTSRLSTIEVAVRSRGSSLPRTLRCPERVSSGRHNRGFGTSARVWPLRCTVWFHSDPHNHQRSGRREHRSSRLPRIRA